MAGTLVLSDKGLVPIEQIKVGDVLLSRQEMTGEVEYKPVAKAFRREGMTILAISCAVDVDGSSSYMLHPSSSQLLWALDKGWRRADALDSGARLLLADGLTAVVLSCVPVYRTTQHDVGWYQKSEFNDHVGFARDFREGEVRSAVPRDDDIFFSEAPQFPATVYGLEVAEFHTYFVGSRGILVCDGCCTIPVK